MRATQPNGLSKEGLSFSPTRTYPTGRQNALLFKEIPCIRSPRDADPGWFGLGGHSLVWWTLAVQTGYAIAKGSAYSRKLTESLAKHYAGASPLQIMIGGLGAAAGEELFFRGFIHGQWGIWAGTLAFGLAHFGGKDIRTVSWWAFPQGFWFGAAYAWTGNLAVPMLAHGLFDIGGMIYFRLLMSGAL